MSRTWDFITADFKGNTPAEATLTMPSSVTTLSDAQFDSDKGEVRFTIGPIYIGSQNTSRKIYFRRKDDKAPEGSACEDKAAFEAKDQDVVVFLEKL